jgi:hypothetical protein
VIGALKYRRRRKRLGAASIRLATILNHRFRNLFQELGDGVGRGGTQVAIAAQSCVLYVVYGSLLGKGGGATVCHNVTAPAGVVVYV